MEQGIKLLVEQDGLGLVEIVLAGAGSASIVRIFVDREKGVSVEDCSRLSRKISDFLDTHDLIPFQYRLEVSSPGLDRPLTNKTDFQRKTGEKVTLYMKDKTDPREQTKGRLVQWKLTSWFCSKREKNKEFL